MSNEISQNKGPKKMGHIAINHKKANVINYVKLPTADTGSDLLDLNNSPIGYSDVKDVGAPLTTMSEVKETAPMMMPEAKEVAPMMMPETKEVAPMMMSETKVTDPIMMPYDNSFSGFDNIGNNREISNVINSDMISNFESRFVKKPVNTLKTDIDITGSSVKKNITGVNMGNNDTSYQL